jgi:hypothetical protein
MMTSQGITSGQIAQLNVIAEFALRKAILAAIDQLSPSPSKEQTQLTIVENGGDFQAVILEEISPVITNVLKRFLLPPDYSNEEIESSFGYLSGYKPKEIVVQINALCELFPGIGYANQDLLAQIENGEAAIPTGAEGWFAIPHWSKVGSTYQEALEEVLALLAKAYGGRFQNYRQGQLGSQYLRETSKKARTMEVLQQRQNKDNIIFVPAQFGLRHKGCSIRRARASMPSYEFGFGAYEIGIMLLTHLERLKHSDDLRIDCAGDEYSPTADGGFEYALCFRFNDSMLEFGCSPVSDTDGRYGSASGFFPR